MIKENKTISVIIVSYNCLSYIINCIESIKCNNDINDNLEIIVVDNSTNSDTYEYFQNHYTDIKILKNDNKGFGEANNVGAELAKGDILLFLNPDTIILSPIFNFVLNKFNNDSELGVFGVKLLDKNRKLTNSINLRHSFGLIKVICARILKLFNFYIPSIMFTSGADIFIPKEVFFKCGQFDDNLFLYYEEADIFNRINNLGFKNKYFKDIGIVHLEGKSTDSNLFNQYKRTLTSAEYYCEKYNIDFKKELRKEIRYCTTKSLILKLLSKERSLAYKEIVCLLRKEYIGVDK